MKYQRKTQVDAALFNGKLTSIEHLPLPQVHQVLGSDIAYIYDDDPIEVNPGCWVVVENNNIQVMGMFTFMSNFEPYIGEFSPANKAKEITMLIAHTKTEDLADKRLHKLEKEIRSILESPAKSGSRNND